MKIVIALRGDRKGASAAEYVLILAIICLAIVAGGTSLGSAVNARLTSASTNIDVGT